MLCAHTDSSCQQNLETLETCQQGKRKSVTTNTSMCRYFGNKLKKRHIRNPAIALVMSSRKNKTNLALAGNNYTNTKPDSKNWNCMYVHLWCWFSSLQAEFYRAGMCFYEFHYCVNAVSSKGLMQVHDAMQVLWVCSAPSLIGVWYWSDKFDFPLWNQHSLPTFISILALPLT